MPAAMAPRFPIVSPPRTLRPGARAAGAALAFALAAVAPAAEPISFEKKIQPLLTRYCYDCHGDGMDKGGVAFDEFKSAAEVRAARKTWESTLRVITRHEMPPPGEAEEFPTEAERETIAQFVERELFQLDPAHPDPGRVTLRRMNRAEYANAIRDLVGVEFNATADFPPDDSGYGFDNIGDVLSLPPVLMEKYFAAADKILDQAIVTEPIRSRTIRVPASLAKVGFNAVGDRGDGWVQLISLEEDDVAVELPILAAGDYIVRFQAFATKTGGALVGQGSDKPVEFKEDPGPTRIALALNDAFVRDFVVGTDEAKPEVYEARLGVPAGRQSFRAVMRRQRHGENELTMLNGRLGKQQPGIVFVKWIELEGPLPAATRRVAPADAAARATGDGRVMPGGARLLEGAGSVETEIVAEREGEFILRAQAYAYQAGDEAVKMEFRVDGKPVQAFDVLAPGEMQPLPRQRVFSPALLVPQPELYETRVQLAAGRHRFAAAFTNPFSDPENKNPNLRQRRLVLQHLEFADLSAPVLTPQKPAPIAELFARHGEDARAIVSAFARRAWRRPPTSGEIERLLKLTTLARAQGESFEGAVKLALKAVLVSPHFLFIGDALAAGEPAGSPAPAGGATVPITELALASRLSFFLWSSGPDEELLALAERGQLRAQLAPQVRRLLASPKAQALVDNFAGQWLQIRSLETFAPDKKLFPDYDPALRAAMQRETELFFAHVLRADRSLLDFLRGDYTFVNPRLAKFYGLPALPATTAADEFRRVSLAATRRRGVLTHASILTLTSNPTRTSPVKRGKWVLENLLGTPPPPPPPEVPELDDKSRQLTGTLRQQMEQHRANPNCASCHARMDPIGFGFENFDAIGAWRGKDGAAPVDAAGELATGEKFADAAALSEILARTRADDFRRCLAEKMLTYALGRGVEYYDRPAVNTIVEKLRAGGDRFSALMLAVAESFPFQHRRAPAAGSAVTVDEIRK
jgi:mono/diheme cytochrome c family protein